MNDIMETIDIALLIGLALMITSLIIMYRCAKGKNRRRKLDELADCIEAAKDGLDCSRRRFDCLLEGLEEDNRKVSLLKNQIFRLEDMCDELENKRCELETSIASLTDIHAELKRNSTGLVEKASMLRDEIAHDKQTIREMEQYISSLKRIREGLEIAVNNIPAEEIPYLSMPVFNMGITPSALNHLTAHGIQYVGDLVQLDEQYLMDIWGVGPATLERIKTKLNENGVCFGMDVVRVGNHWYRRKTD